MAQVKVLALVGFDHYGKVSRGQYLMLDETHAHKMAMNGLIEIVRTEIDLKKKELSPVLLAAPVSQEKIVKKSKGGGKKAQKKTDS